MEGGNDVGVAGPGIEKVAGASGYDFEIGQGDPQPQDADLALPIPPLDILQVGVRDKFNEVEALSGWKFDDKLRGDDIIPARLVAPDSSAVMFSTRTASTTSAVSIRCCPPSTRRWSTSSPPRRRRLPDPDRPQRLGLRQYPARWWWQRPDRGPWRGRHHRRRRYFSVRLSVRTTREGTGPELGWASIEAPASMQSAMTTQYLRNADGSFVAGSPTLQQAVFAGTVNPGQIVAVQEILTGTGGTDTALFSGPVGNYTITSVPAADGNEAAVSVLDNVGTDGNDLVRNVETLRFTDGDLTVAPPAAPVIGAASATNASATVNFTAPAGLLTGFTVEAVPATGPTITAQVTDETATSATVNGLTNGVAYRFRVAAVNAFGTGAFSALSNAVTPLAPAPVATLTPAAGLTFATTTVAATSPALTATLTNSGNAQLGSISRALGGTNPGDFVLGATTCGATLNAGASCTTSITFRPTAAGARSATFVVTDNATGSPRSITLTGAGVAAPVDATAPTVTARVPAVGATGVAVANDLSATFSEAVQGVTAATFTVRQGANPVLAGTVARVGTTNQYTLNPTANLAPSTVYTVTLTGNATTGIRDNANNALATVSWTFTTAAAPDTVPPTVTARTPAVGATGVAVANNVTTTFSEALNAATLTHWRHGHRDGPAGHIGERRVGGRHDRLQRGNPGDDLQPDRESGERHPVHGPVDQRHP